MDQTRNEGGEEFEENLVNKTKLAGADKKKQQRVPLRTMEEGVMTPCQHLKSLVISSKVKMTV